MTEFEKKLIVLLKDNARYSLKELATMTDSDEKNQAILQGDAWTNSPYLWEPISEDLSNGWDLEFYSNEESEIDNSYSWVVEKFNEFIYFLNNFRGEDFKNGISNYVNVDRCIDVLLFTSVAQAGDNFAKNILWITYDGGNTWQPSVYDLDGTWGSKWDGSILYDSMTYLDLSVEYGNQLFRQLFRNFHDEIVERYKELRADVLSDENILNAFETFFDGISETC